MTLVINSPVTSILELYDVVARAVGKDPKKCHYDCTKIRVAPNFADEIEAAYKHKYFDDYKMTFGMHWVAFGPKVDEDLRTGIVKLEEGFFA